MYRSPCVRPLMAILKKLRLKTRPFKRTGSCPARWRTTGSGAPLSFCSSMSLKLASNQSFICSANLRWVGQQILCGCRQSTVDKISCYITHNLKMCVRVTGNHMRTWIPIETSNTNPTDSHGRRLGYAIQTVPCSCTTSEVIVKYIWWDFVRDAANSLTGLSSNLTRVKYIVLGSILRHKSTCRGVYCAFGCTGWLKYEAMCKCVIYVHGCVYICTCMCKMRNLCVNVCARAHGPVIRLLIIRSQFQFPTRETCYVLNRDTSSQIFQSTQLKMNN